jgi:RNA polymerase sigma-54 factor
LALEQRIKQEIEENPALEEGGGDEIEELQEEMPTDSVASDEDEFREDSEEEGAPENDDFTLEDYMEEDEIPEYRLVANNKSRDDEVYEMPVVSGTSFQEFLISQLGLHNVTDKQYVIAITLIGNLDDSGYLQRELPALVDDLAFNHNLEATTSDVEEVLKIIHEFDPPGIGARNLQECLALQMERKAGTSPAVDLALLILNTCFAEFSKKHFDKIILKTHCTEKELKEAIEEIQKLDPKPGIGISELSRESNYIIPDFIITNEGGILELSLNSRNSPELNVNRQYMDMLRSYSSNGNKTSKAGREAASFIRQKVESARGFIDAIRQREETLYITMRSIMEYQKEYFLTGDETKLKPMILKDIASVIQMDISTVSRVANSKYVQTPFGTFLLKSFFSESMQNSKGEEISTREIKKILKDCIEAEDKSDPLTDDHLVDLLKEKGYNIARRTIAKYREQLNIPVARMRKEL